MCKSQEGDMRVRLSDNKNEEIEISEPKQLYGGQAIEQQRTFHLKKC